jgi:hypothetical protein
MSKSVLDTFAGSLGSGRGIDCFSGVWSGVCSKGVEVRVYSRCSKFERLDDGLVEASGDMTPVGNGMCLASVVG